MIRPYLHYPEYQRFQPPSKLSKVQKKTVKSQEKLQISSCKILNKKWYHAKVLPKRFRSNAGHITKTWNYTTDLHHLLWVKFLTLRIWREFTDN